MSVTRVTTINKPVLLLILSRDSTILFKASDRKYSCERECAERNQKGAHHALHATSVQQTGDVLDCRTQVEALREQRCVESVDDGIECIGDREMLYNDSVEHGHNRREQHDRDGRLLP